MTESKLVLIIEDDPWLGQLFERCLRSEGYDTRLITNAIAAMELIDELEPDALVLDMLLGGATGLTLLHELQSYQDTAKIPVILCTNLAAGIKPADVAPYGVCRILDKTTMHPDDVAVAVRTVLA